MQVDTNYLLNNLSKLLRINKQITLFFLLENNRAALLDAIILTAPRILLNPFFANYEQKENTELSVFLAQWLTKQDFKNLAALKIPFDTNADNWTTDSRALNVLNIDEETDTRDSSAVVNWFSNFITGSTSTTTTDSTAEKTGIAFAVVGLLGLVALLIWGFTSIKK